MMNYSDGTEVKPRDYVYLESNGGGFVQDILEPESILVRNFETKNILWMKVDEVKFNQRGAPDPTGKTEIFLVKKYGWKVVLKLDTSLIPDQEWRDTFYDFHTLRDIANHYVWNMYRQGFSSVEGLFEEQHKPPYLWIIHAEKG